MEKETYRAEEEKGMEMEMHCSRSCQHRRRRSPRCRSPRRSGGACPVSKLGHHRPLLVPCVATYDINLGRACKLFAASTHQAFVPIRLPCPRQRPSYDAEYGTHFRAYAAAPSRPSASRRSPSSNHQCWLYLKKRTVRRISSKTSALSSDHLACSALIRNQWTLMTEICVSAHASANKFGDATHLPPRSLRTPS